MLKQLILVSVVGGSLCAAPFAMAVDVQQQSGDTGNSSSPPPAQQTSSSSTSSSTDNYQSLPLKQRVRRLERILDSQSLQDMLTRLDTLQNEVQSLRGDLQVQNHQLDQLKKRQRDLYVDIDRRLTRLERNNGSAGAGIKPGSVGDDVAGASSTASASNNNSAANGNNAATNSASSSAKTSTPTDTAGEQQAYQKAFDTLRNLRYDQAVKQFRAFIAKYPNGRYAHIAQYWIAEAEYAERNFKQAIEDYQKLIDKYPNSPKLAEAMLKIGYSQYELNDNKDAITILHELIKSYPGTTEAGQAQNLLRKIRQSS